MKRDQEIFDLIGEEKERQLHGIELIASENFVSDEVMQAMGSVLTNKYAEGLPGKRYYGGCEVVDKVEQLAIDRLCKLFGATWANVQPHSGAQANAAVFLACLNPGDKILGFDLSHGGHLTHGSPVNFSGKLYEPHFYGVNKETGRVDYDQLEEVALRVKPKMIICGASAYSRDWDYARIRKVADQIGAVILADISHPAGLIAAGLLSDPLDHCHIVTTTTHKTLRGPRGGIIMAKPEYEKALNSAIFPQTQGGPLMHVIAAKAVAFKEAASNEFKDYQEQVINNARVMAKTLQERGLRIVSGRTDCHLFLVDLRAKNLTGKQAEESLGVAHITVNKNAIPNDPQKPFVTSGIRIGSPAITTRGFREIEAEQLANLIADVLEAPTDATVLLHVAQKTKALCAKFPVYGN